MGNRKKKRKPRSTRSQHLKELKDKKIKKVAVDSLATPPPPAILHSPLSDSTPHFSPPSTSSPILASARKLNYSNEMNISLEGSGSEFMLVGKKQFQQFANKYARCECGERLTVKIGNVCGMAKTFLVECELCSEKSTWCTSPGGVKEGYEVHRRVVEGGLHCGDGFVAAQKFCMALNMPMMHHKTFYKYQKDIEESSIKKYEELLEQTREKVHRVLEEKDPSAPEVKEVKVSVDGSWARRGFTSKYGFVSVIEYLTGMVVDHVILSKWCRVCALQEGTGRAREEWWPEHASECEQNYDGSSPAMEMHGWKILFGRSLEKCKMKYVRVVSDGDTKGFAAVRDMKPYGGDVEIKKEECTNHVAKRLGKALLGLKLGGNKKGSLTVIHVKKIQNYFTNAVKKHSDDVDEMKKAIYATLRHCSSTDDHPQHSTCPQGEDSWCFVQRAIAMDQPIPPHKENIHTPLRQDVLQKMMPLYQRLVTPQLLRSCLGDTQNANESLHSVIWSELPKRKFFGLKRMMYSVHRSVTKFNLGAAAAEVEGLGNAALKVAKEKNKVRVKKAKRKMEDKEERKNKKIKSIQEEERKKRAEGTTYEAGGAALPP